jgi:hypothetical protein
LPAAAMTISISPSVAPSRAVTFPLGSRVIFA